MSTGILERTLAILELLASRAEEMPLGQIAAELDIPPSAVHRLLNELAKHGYVRQAPGHGRYRLTTKLVSLGLSFLSATQIVDVAQPLLDDLAMVSGELVRLSVVDGDRLTWVAKAQGAKSGLRYDPEMGLDAHLSCSASGHAWMLGMSDEEALMRVARQGFGPRTQFGPNAPETAQELLAMLAAARQRGFSITLETFTHSMSAMAAPVRRPGEDTIGVISVAGPTMRFTEARMMELGPALLQTAADLAVASRASPMFRLQPRPASAPHPIAEERPVRA